MQKDTADVICRNVLLPSLARMRGPAGPGAAQEPDFPSNKVAMAYCNCAIDENQAKLQSTSVKE
jgi:hypothetical protein